MKDIKKYLIGGIIGLIIGSIGVYAGTLMNSNEVTFTPKNNKWNVTKVDEALNSLYSVAVPEEYSGTTLVTPTYSDITLNTQDKLLKNNITINGIPSTYKNLTNTTTGTSSDLATGKTLYNSDGSLITGTALLDGDCVSGVYTMTSDCTTSTGCTMFEGFNPSKFSIFFTREGGYFNYYNSEINPSIAYENTSKGVNSFNLGDGYVIANNKVIMKNFRTVNISNDAYYIVCK